MHQTSGRWKYGLALSLMTALMWGTLAIALKMLLVYMDPYSITWYRMLVAAVILGCILALKGQFPDWRKLKGKTGLLIAIATLALTGNFVFYLISLDFISPGVAQVVIQLAPVFLLTGGVLVFGESFNRTQFVGLIVLVAGMLLFMNQRLQDLFSKMDDYSIGVVIMIVAAIVWSIYALIQKQLLKELRSESILFWVYLGSALVLIPTTDVASVESLDALGWALLAFACLNSIFAYGGFAEALDHWEASRISAVLTLVPLLTLGFVELIHWWFPERLASENLNLLGYCGALIVVTGSAITALAGQKKVST
ncbi:MAG: DMT family transporter [Gammaproteobacteria bacterium]|nr:DMT family transporter [Gammaproteobacteria bacterium]